MSSVPQPFRNTRFVFASLRRATASIKSTVKGTARKTTVPSADLTSFGCPLEWWDHYDANCNPTYIVGDYMPPTGPCPSTEDDEGKDDGDKEVVDTITRHECNPSPSSSPKPRVRGGNDDGDKEVVVTVTKHECNPSSPSPPPSLKPKVRVGNDDGDKEVVVAVTKPRYPTELDEFRCMFTLAERPPPIPAAYSSTHVPTSLATLFDPPTTRSSSPSSAFAPSYPHSPSFYSSSSTSLLTPSSGSSSPCPSPSYTYVSLDKLPHFHKPSPLSSCVHLPPPPPSKFEKIIDTATRSLRIKKSA